MHVRMREAALGERTHREFRRTCRQAVTVGRLQGAEAPISLHFTVFMLTGAERRGGTPLSRWSVISGESLLHCFYHRAWPDSRQRLLQNDRVDKKMSLLLQHTFFDRLYINISGYLCLFIHTLSHDQAVFSDILHMPRSCYRSLFPRIASLSCIASFHRAFFSILSNTSKRETIRSNKGQFPTLKCIHKPDV
jgi:hypothetical protein